MPVRARLLAVGSLSRDQPTTIGILHDPGI